MRRRSPALIVAGVALFIVVGGLLLIANAKAGKPRAPVLAQTQALRLELWRMQDAMVLPRTRTSYSDRRRHASRAYRLWVRDLWRARVLKLRPSYAEWRERFAYGVWDRLAVCETGGNWQHYNSTYQGGLGFYHGSWDAYRPTGFPVDAHLATREQQIVVGQRVLAAVGWEAWPACSIRLGLR